MQIRKYRGKDVKEALNAVKEELGPDALILDTKKSVSGGFVEISAAIEADEPAPERASLRSEQAAMTGNTARVTPQEHMVAGRQAVDGYGSQYMSEDDGTRHVLRELQGLKDFLSVISVRDETPGGKNFIRLEEEMSKDGIDRSFIHDVLISTISRVANDGGGIDIESLRSEVKSAVLSEISMKNPISDKNQTTMALIGPTGVGKTTTLAKLASIMALKKKKKVALLTMDTFRIAAVDQLKRYGDIIGVPVNVAETPEDVKMLIARHSDKDLILIDTAGRGRGDIEQMGKLQTLAELESRVKFNLVLSVNTRDACLYDTVKRFGGVDIDSLTFTKLDEGTGFGPIFNTARYSGKPLAYFTDGQRVPEDIEAASSKRLESLFLAV